MTSKGAMDVKLSGWTVVAVVLVLAVGATDAQAQFDEPGRGLAGGGAGAGRGEVGATRITLGEALRALEARFRVTITPGPEVALSLPVTIPADGATLEEALKAVLQPLGLIAVAPRGDYSYQVRAAPGVSYVHQFTGELGLGQCAAILRGAEDAQYGRGDPGPKYRAIMRLAEIGSPQAVKVLGEFLLGANPDHLKKTALCVLGLLGSEEAIDAIATFEQWAAARYTAAPQRPSYYQPLASCTDENGAIWEVFRAYKFDGPDTFIVRCQEDGAWDRPILLEIGEDDRAWHESQFDLTLGEGQFTLTTRTPFTLEPFLTDQDGDGLTDLVELRMGTRRDNSDTDGDGVPDGEDSNPLTPRHETTDDAAEIRQAVFSILFATRGDDRAIWVVGDEDFAHQEYYGYEGPVLRRWERERGTANIVELAVEIITPTTAAARITSGPDYAAQLIRAHGKWVVTSFAQTNMP